MNFQQLKSLFMTNLIYSNPQSTQQLRKKGKGEVTVGLFKTYLIISPIMLLVFGMMMIFIDFPHYPGYFTYYCALYVLMGASTIITPLYNVFFESKDIKDYLPLPFTNASIYLAKLLVVALVTLPYLLPILMLFLLTGFKGIGILGILTGIIGFLIFTSIFVMLCIALVSLLVQSKFFQKYKKITSVLLTFIPAIGVMFGFLFINQRNSVSLSGGKLADRGILYPFLPFHDWLANPISLRSILTFLGAIILLGFLYLLLRQHTIPKMFKVLLNEQAVPQTVRKSKNLSPSSLEKQFLSYNLGLVKNPTLWMQTLTMTFVIPISMIFGASISGRIDLSQIQDKFFIVTVLAGISFSFITVNNASIVSMIISLDRENFNYIQSLPISLKDYLKEKFKFAFLIQVSMNVLVVLGMTIYFKLSLLLILGAVLGSVIGTYLFSLYYFANDWNHLTLNWTAISQLYTRGGGGFRIFIIYFLAFLVTIISSVGIVLVIFALRQPLLINLSILLLLVGIFVIIYRHYRTKFWGQFNKR